MNRFCTHYEAGFLAKPNLYSIHVHVDIKHLILKNVFYYYIDTVDGKNPAPPGMYKTL